VAAIHSDRPFPSVDGAEVTHRYVAVNGINIHVAEAGHANAEPLFMYHGWPQHWWMWRKQIPLFAKRFRVIVPDMRGFGWSDAPNRSYLKDTLTEEFVQLVKVMGYEQIRLLSHDWGGWLGFIACAKYPGLIAQHFATNIPPIFPKYDWRTVLATLRFGYMLRISMPFFGPRMLMRDGTFVHHLFTRSGTADGKWTEQAKNIFSDQFKDPARARASSRLYGEFLLKEYLPVGMLGKYKRYRIHTPTRLLFGEKDFALDLCLLREAEPYFDDYQLELVPNTGHFIVDEQPDLINERAWAFFTDARYAIRQS
jgi:pimeloyl-ACP methyl ester carboxylesterase